MCLSVLIITKPYKYLVNRKMHITKIIALSKIIKKNKFQD